jgi:uncharacterized protein YjiS (DUF1127 family)
MSAIPTTSAPAAVPHLLDVVGAALRRLTQAMRAYRNRREAHVLATLDERMLADIGLTRSDVRDAFAEPLWHDPTNLLRARSLERRLSRHGISLGFGRAVVASPSLAPQDVFAPPRTDRPARFTV